MYAPSGLQNGVRMRVIHAHGTLGNKKCNTRGSGPYWDVCRLRNAVQAGVFEMES